MNLRNATIWTTGTMLVVTLLVPTIISGSGLEVVGVVEAIFGAVFFWLLSGSPLLVSYFVSKNLKHDIPAVILLFSTIAYGSVYVWILCQAIFVEGWMFPILVLIGMASLPVMIPAWIAALILNSYYVTKTPDPGTARSTATSPALFDE